MATRLGSFLAVNIAAAILVFLPYWVCARIIFKRYSARSFVFKTVRSACAVVILKLVSFWIVYRILITNDVMGQVLLYLTMFLFMPEYSLARLIGFRMPNNVATFYVMATLIVAINLILVVLIVGIARIRRRDDKVTLR